jgi:hypothetical protein
MSRKNLENKIIEVCNKAGVDPNELDYENILNSLEKDIKLKKETKN